MNAIGGRPVRECRARLVHQPERRCQDLAGEVRAEVRRGLDRDVERVPEPVVEHVVGSLVLGACHLGERERDLGIVVDEHDLDVGGRPARLQRAPWSPSRAR
jgi:hypothetical protein